jgi:hypothetical protein
MLLTAAVWLSVTLAQPATPAPPTTALPGEELPLGRAVPGIALIIAGLVVLILVRAMGRRADRGDGPRKS